MSSFNRFLLCPPSADALHSNPDPPIAKLSLALLRCAFCIRGRFHAQVGPISTIFFPRPMKQNGVFTPFDYLASRPPSAYATNTPHDPVLEQRSYDENPSRNPGGCTPHVRMRATVKPSSEVHRAHFPDLSFHLKCAIALHCLLSRPYSRQSSQWPCHVVPFQNCGAGAALRWRLRRSLSRFRD